MLKKDLVQKCPLLKTLPSRGVVALLQHLTTEIALPNDLVLRQGELADSMYFISRGSVSAFHTLGRCDEYLATLVEGAFFGEVGLLEKLSRRVSSIVAETYCELQRLSKEDFRLIYNTFSEFRDALTTLAEERLTKLKAQVTTARNTQTMKEHFMKQKGSNGEILSIHKLALISRRTDKSPISKIGSTQRKLTSLNLTQGISAKERFAKAKNAIQIARVFATNSLDSGDPPTALGSPMSTKSVTPPPKKEEDEAQANNDDAGFLNLQVSHSMACAFQPGGNMDADVARSFLSTPGTARPRRWSQTRSSNKLLDDVPET